jgi:hypothetical protein
MDCTGLFEWVLIGLYGFERASNVGCDRLGIDYDYLLSCGFSGLTFLVLRGRSAFVFAD